MVTLSKFNDVCREHIHIRWDDYVGKETISWGLKEINKQESNWVEDMVTYRSCSRKKTFITFAYSSPTNWNRSSQNIFAVHSWLKLFQMIKTGFFSYWNCGLHSTKNFTKPTAVNRFVSHCRCRRLNKLFNIARENGYSFGRVEDV